MKGIQSGYGNNYLPLWAVFNLYIIFICTSIAGLAVSPIMGDLTRIFPGTTPLMAQMLEIGPNLAAIPFVFLGGWIGTKFNNNKLTTWTCVFYSICSILFFFIPTGSAHGMLFVIILSFLIGIAAGVLSPLSTAFIADMFGGKKRTAQYGYTSATLNLVLMGCTIATGYLAKINWHLPFLVYLLPIIPLFFAHKFKKYITNPSQIRQADQEANGGKKVHYKFSQQVNIGMFVRYCVFYFVITFVIAAISLYLPFRYTDSATAGDLTSILFFGIMISGYLLNYVLKIMKKGVAIICMIAIAGGFILMSITTEVVLVGIGIFIATFFYGIAQPYYDDRLSMASSRIALTLTLAWFASMDSIGNVVAAPLIDLMMKIFHKSTSTDPGLAFWLCTGLSVAGLVVVIIRKIIVGVKDHVEKHEAQPAVALATAAAAAPASDTQTQEAPALQQSAPAQAAPAAAPQKEAAPAPQKEEAPAPEPAPTPAPATARDAAEAAAEAAQEVANKLEAEAHEAEAKAQQARQEAAEAEAAAAEAEAAAAAAEKVAAAAEGAATALDQPAPEKPEAEADNQNSDNQ